MFRALENENECFLPPPPQLSIFCRCPALPTEVLHHRAFSDTRIIISSCVESPGPFERPLLFGNQTFGKPSRRPITLLLVPLPLLPIDLTMLPTIEHNQKQDLSSTRGRRPTSPKRPAPTTTGPRRRRAATPTAVRPTSRATRTRATTPAGAVRKT